MPLLRDEKASLPEIWLLAVVALATVVLLPVNAAFFRPGFTLYDEEAQLDLIQAWREGADLPWRFGYGSIHRGLVACFVQVAGTHLSSFRLPSLLALCAELVLLYLWLKPKFGERSAVWACLGNLVCTATFSRGGAMLSSSLFPALFLAHLVWAERIQRPWQACLWGLSALVWCLDYEGWGAALLILVPATLWQLRQQRNALLSLVLGACLGALFVGILSANWLDYLAARAHISRAELTLPVQIFVNVRDLLLGGHRMLFAAAPDHSLPAPWLWPLITLGAWPALRAYPLLGPILLVGSLPLAMRLTAMEPQRLGIAWVALAAISGVGASLLWEWRKPAGRWLCGLLLAWGLINETLAWVRSDPLKVELAYGLSYNCNTAAEWLRHEAPPQGWRVIDGLGIGDDGSFRFLLDAKRVARSSGGKPVALIHWDYLPGLKGLKGQLITLDSGGSRPIYLFIPSAEADKRLTAIQAQLQPLHATLRTALSPTVFRQTLAQLQSKELRDPWARTVTWEVWLRASRQYNKIDGALVRQALKEPLVNGWFYDIVADLLKSSAPDQAAILRAKAEHVDPRRATVLFRTLRH